MQIDADYVTRLKHRDPETCTAFVTSLTPVIEARLRWRVADRADVEDARNETFYRVFKLLDAGRVREPASLPAFVWGVCDRVAYESHRAVRLSEPLPEGGREPADPRPPLETTVARKQMAALLRREIAGLDEEYRTILMEICFQERDRRQMERERGMSPSGLNVKLCRAKKRLKSRFLQAYAHGAGGRRASGAVAIRRPPRKGSSRRLSSRTVPASATMAA